MANLIIIVERIIVSQQQWILEGRVTQFIYSPRGGLEGLLVDVEGVDVQFVVPEHLAWHAARLKLGESASFTGCPRGPSNKGEPAHEVYELSELPSVQTDHDDANGGHRIRGKVVRFNYAKHGEANGVILDTGDFLHTKPAELKKLGWQVGDEVEATGSRSRLFDGLGAVIEVE